MPPAAPPAPREPADPLRALAAGLLNLSGLGLGYLATRRWLALAVALIGTGVFLFAALPADPDGVSRGALVAYLVFLGLTAVHGAARGLRTRLAFPPQAPLALLLGVVLLAVPAGSVVYYKGAKDDATQQMLLDRLDKADKLVQAAKGKPFATAKKDYDRALGSYGDLDAHHKDSKAAGKVPDRMRTFYATVGAPYDKKKYCDAIDPLTYLRTVPGTIDRKTLGSLAGWPDDRLATSLYECGVADLQNGDGSTASGGDENDLGELLATFPHSAQAAKVEPAVSGTIDKAYRGLKGSDPCSANDRLRGLGSFASTLAGKQAGGSAALAKDAHRADGYRESGTYACGLDQYKDKDFDSAADTMHAFASKYPHDKNASYAKKVAIAAEIAQEDPDAGRHLPSKGSGGGITVTVSNDSPDDVQILYTGTVTGSFTLKGCGSCSTYSSDAVARMSACKSGKHYPKRTLSLPPGTIYFLHKPSDGSSATASSDSEKLRYGYIYTECAYTVQTFGL